AKDVLLKLFDADAEYSADTLEDIYDQLEKAGKLVLSEDVTDELAGDVLGAIARQEDLNGRIRRNVMDTRRAVSFMMRAKMLNAEQFEEARQILRDIESLDNHTAFLFDKINFLMDATVGFININQNKIIKIFSVASVALLPPTLIASIYGMNFQFMPELDKTWGYPFALALMVASALVHGSVRLAAFTPERLVDAQVRGLMQRLSLSADAQIDAGFPGQRAARVRLVTHDGREDVFFQPNRKGDPEDPLTDADLDGKFIELAAPVIGDAPARALLQQLWQLELATQLP
ncbi:MAG: Magnesium transport protein CorA, partial [Pseudomonadota bacterium]